MKIDLTDTTSARINAGLIDARRAIGTPAVGMVLTLVIVTDEGSAYDALKSAHEASREHPSRILVVIKRPGRSPRERAGARLDAEVVVGAEAGTGETVVLRMHGELANHSESVVLPLLLPDAPVVCWWPDQAPDKPGADPLGRLAQRRITDASSAEDPVGSIEVRAGSYLPGDTDLAWTRITPWRSMLAAALDQKHSAITSASVEERRTTRAPSCSRCGSPTGWASRWSARSPTAPASPRYACSPPRATSAWTAPTAGSPSCRCRDSQTGTWRSSGGRPPN